MTTPDDPLLERLRQLPGARLDDVSAARTLARAEAAFASAAAGAGIAARPRRTRWLVPAALAMWAVLYGGGAVRELGRLFPSAAAGKPAVATNHRGRPDFFNRWSVHVERHQQAKRENDGDDDDRAAAPRHPARNLSFDIGSVTIRRVL